MKKKIITILLTLTTFLSAVPVLAYPDCTYENVMALAELGILSGDENGNFNPNSLLTRAEFSRMMIPLLLGTESIDELDFSDYETPFNDIKSHWAYKYIAVCNMNNLIDGFEDDTFRPEGNVTYAQAVKICLCAAGYSGLAKNTYPWHKTWTVMALEQKLIDSESANPDTEITRLEAAELVYKAINMPVCVISGYAQVDTNESGPVWGPTFEIMDGTNGEFMSLYTLRFSSDIKE